ncbi:unnamed protein product [Urochloa humidicola]
MVVSVAATEPGTDAEPVSSTFFASRYVRDPLPRSVAVLPLPSGSSVPFQYVRRAEAGGWARSPRPSIITSTSVPPPRDVPVYHQFHRHHHHHHTN